MRRFALALFLFGSVAADEFKAIIETPHSEVSLFETLPVHLTLTYPKGYSVDPTLLKNNLLQGIDFGIAPFRLVQFSQEKQEQGDLVTERMTFILEPQTLGNKTLTFWKIPFIPPSGQNEATLLSDLVEVKITEPLQHAKELLGAPLMALSETFPIDLNSENLYLLADLEKEEPLRNVKIFKERSFAWLGWLALVFGGLFLWTYRPTKAKNLREDDKRKARAQLRQFLNELEKAAKDEDLTVFYEKLLTHLRFYFEKFYGFRIDALTTEEFLQKMTDDKKIPQQARIALQEIMQEADRVRFGHTTTMHENAQKGLNLIRESFLYG